MAALRNGFIDKVKKSGAVVQAIGFYWFVSISLVFINKLAFSTKVEDKPALDAPLFITWIQIIVAIQGCVMLASLKKSKLNILPKFLITTKGALPNEIVFSPKVAISVLPLTGIFLGMITFNNLCLKYVQVSFYHVARALSVCFNVLFTFLMFGSKTSSKCLLTLAIVVIGYVLGVDGEIEFSPIGVFFGIMSSVFVALYSNFVKQTLASVGDDTWTLMFYNNVNAFFLMPFLIFGSGEHSELLSNWTRFFDRDTLLLILSSGVFGFLINIASFLQIKMTSPLTHNVSGIAKAGVQTIIAYLFFGNPPTFKGISGLLLVLGGSFFYGYFRSSEPKQPKKKSRDLEAASNSAPTLPEVPPSKSSSD